MKVENTPTHHYRELNILETPQASSLAKFKATSSKLGQTRHSSQSLKEHKQLKERETFWQHQLKIFYPLNLHMTNQLKDWISHLSISGIVVHDRCYISPWFYFSVIFYFSGYFCDCLSVDHCFLFLLSFLLIVIRATINPF